MVWVWVWVAMVIALLAMLAVSGVVLVRKVIALLTAFSDLIGRTAVLDGVHRAEPEQRPVPAAFAGLETTRTSWRRRRWLRRERRAGLRRSRIERGRTLLRADVRSTDGI